MGVLPSQWPVSCLLRKPFPVLCSGILLFPATPAHVALVVPWVITLTSRGLTEEEGQLVCRPPSTHCEHHRFSSLLDKAQILLTPSRSLATKSQGHISLVREWPHQPHCPVLPIVQRPKKKKKKVLYICPFLGVYNYDRPYTTSSFVEVSGIFFFSHASPSGL